MRSKATALSRFTKLEMQVLEALWSHGKASIREIHELFPEPRPAYTTVQTVVNRLAGKQAVRRVRKISNAHIYEAVVERQAAQLGVLEQILGFFGGRALPMMAQLAEAGKLTMQDVRELERVVERLDRESARKQERA